MIQVTERLLDLRTSVNMSQARLSRELGISQSAINRYEHNEAAVPDSALLKYAEYFDVLLDYIFGRTDKPEGKLFEARPKLGGNNEELRQFIEMCFDPNSKMSGKLKDTLFQMIAGGDKE